MESRNTSVECLHCWRGGEGKTWIIWRKTRNLIGSLEWNLRLRHGYRGVDEWTRGDGPALPFREKRHSLPRECWGSEDAGPLYVHLLEGSGKQTYWCLTPYREMVTKSRFDESLVETERFISISWNKQSNRLPLYKQGFRYFYITHAPGSIFLT